VIAGWNIPDPLLRTYFEGKLLCTRLHTGPAYSRCGLDTVEIGGVHVAFLPILITWNWETWLYLNILLDQSMGCTCVHVPWSPHAGGHWDVTEVTTVWLNWPFSFTGYSSHCLHTSHFTLVTTIALVTAATLVTLQKHEGCFNRLYLHQCMG